MDRTLGDPPPPSMADTGPNTEEILAMLLPGDDPQRAADAARRLRLVAPRNEEDFRRAWAFLDTWFGLRDELERLDVLLGWWREPRRQRVGSAVRSAYFMLLAWDGPELVGVRDAYLMAEPGGGLAVSLLSHSLVAPTHRRSGLAALFRAAPAAALAAHARRAGAPEATGWLVAEMEPLTPGDPASLTRLAAYGRAGFRAASPLAFPYAQPDFRDLGALGLAPRPLPLLAVLRPTTVACPEALLPDELRAILGQIHAFQSWNVGEDALRPIARWVEGALSRHGPGPVPLHPLPRSLLDDTRDPLLRDRVLSFYPAGWRPAAASHPDTP